MKRYMKKSWQRVTNNKLTYEIQRANQLREGYLRLMGCVICEMYMNYEEIYFIDEFYIWNNQKNSGIYSWFDRGKDAATLEISDGN